MKKYFLIILIFISSGCAQTSITKKQNINRLTPSSFSEVDLNKDNVIDKKEAEILFNPKSKADSDTPFWVFLTLSFIILSICCLPLVITKGSVFLKNSRVFKNKK